MPSAAPPWFHNSHCCERFLFKSKEAWSGGEKGTSEPAFLVSLLWHTKRGVNTVNPTLGDWWVPWISTDIYDDRKEHDGPKTLRFLPSHLHGHSMIPDSHLFQERAIFSLETPLSLSPQTLERPWKTSLGQIPVMWLKLDMGSKPAQLTQDQAEAKNWLTGALRQPLG